MDRVADEVDQTTCRSLDDRLADSWSGSAAVVPHPCRDERDVGVLVVQRVEFQARPSISARVDAGSGDPERRGVVVLRADVGETGDNLQEAPGGDEHVDVVVAAHSHDPAGELFAGGPGVVQAHPDRCRRGEIESESQRLVTPRRHRQRDEIAELDRMDGVGRIDEGPDGTNLATTGDDRTGTG